MLQKLINKCLLTVFVFSVCYSFNVSAHQDESDNNSISYYSFQKAYAHQKGKSGKTSHKKHWRKKYRHLKDDEDNEPTPTVTYGPEDAIDGDVITEGGELVEAIPFQSERWYLHNEIHGKEPLESRGLPPYYVDIPRDMFELEDFVIKKDEMVVINPAPGEYVFVMEGQRHGYDNTTIGITRTGPGKGAPLHTHLSEESHVLLKGKTRYQLGDEVFEVEAPYVINIPSMVPHAFMNLDPEEPYDLIGFFPDNVWGFDIVEHENQEEFFTLPEKKSVK